MRRLFLTALGATVAAGAPGPLPIRPGQYVIAGTPCAEPPLAALLRYDGRALVGAHESACAARVLGRSGAVYRLNTTCRALGDGTPAAPLSYVARYRVLSPTAFDVLPPRGTVLTYRWCAR